VDGEVSLDPGGTLYVTLEVFAPGTVSPGDQNVTSLDAVDLRFVAE
jgi:hypothetical protein